MDVKDIMMLQDVAAALDQVPVAGQAHRNIVNQVTQILAGLVEKYKEKENADTGESTVQEQHE